MKSAQELLMATAYGYYFTFSWSSFAYSGYLAFIKFIMGIHQENMLLRTHATHTVGIAA